VLFGWDVQQVARVLDDDETSASTRATRSPPNGIA
jgi:hypothetical protein